MGYNGEMSNEKSLGGYILLSRKIIESEIWSKPPLYLKVWIWLLNAAQHKEYKKLKRGQLHCQISDIQDGVAWYVGYRKVTPTKDQIYQIIDWMRKGCERGYEADTRATMITTTKATRGLLINIDNYSYYQDSKNYESNGESNNEKVTKPTREQRQPNTINKNVKNDKNEKNNIYSHLVDQYTQNVNLKKVIFEFINHRKSIKKPIKSEYGMNLVLKKLDKLSSNDDEKIEIVNASILNSWLGLYELKGGKESGRAADIVKPMPKYDKSKILYRGGADDIDPNAPVNF